MSVLVVFHALLVRVLTLRILLRDDLTPPARLAWFVVLILLPYLGSVVYFLFGENDLGRAADARYREIVAEIRDKADRFMGEASAVDSPIDPAYRPAFDYAASINGFRAREGNAAVFTLVDFSAAFLFIAGSTLFFEQSTTRAATWMFLVGSVCFARRPTIRVVREFPSAESRGRRRACGESERIARGGASRHPPAFGTSGNDVAVGADIIVRATVSGEFASTSGRYFDDDA